jgi:diguanylate cyclase (GGDEF)-like protein
LTISLDNFLSGHLIVSAKRNVCYCNNYIEQQFGWSLDDKNHISLASLFTKSSNIFIDSFVYPLLIDQTHAEEIQLTMLSFSGERFPVIANIKISEDMETFWSLFICVNRNKLFEELIQTRERLEKQSEALSELATIDPLTGLLNRRELNKRADRMLIQTRRLNLELVILVIDIDIDNLKCVSKAISNGRRNEDIVARYGGEEFVLLLSNINKMDAVRIAEAIRISIESATMEEANITVSIGIASVNKDNREGFDSLFNRADAALLIAKKSGRNKVVIS